MDISKLSKRQKDILKKLEKDLGSKELLDKWLSTPNHYFRKRPPIDLLIMGDFEYFDAYLSKY